jgi:glycosyltransferase involved in cell wall biosynthesis
MDGISFIVTIFNKTRYLPRVIEALELQTGPFAREFIFVDDGSTDGSAEMISKLTAGWREPGKILRQENSGASAASNFGASHASLPWLKLVDGDDLLLPGATEALWSAARKAELSFAYGDLDFYDPDDAEPLGDRSPSWSVEPVADGLARFIRNCPANSSSILVSAERYRAAGGCDERLVSPDVSLFLRLFAGGSGIRLRGPVALIPRAAPGRLSGQHRRSRYESVLALYYLVTETRGLDPSYARLASRRALSRAYRFHVKYGKRFSLGHLARYLASQLRLPLDPATTIYRSLGAFTEDGRSERPASWLPGALHADQPGSTAERTAMGTAEFKSHPPYAAMAPQVIRSGLMQNTRNS